MVNYFVRMGGPFILLVLLAPSWAGASVLLFEGFGNPNLHPAIPAAYGDRVIATTDANGYKYGSAGGFTPNVVVDYKPDSGGTFELWNGYGDLVGALGDNNFQVPGEIVFSPDPGFGVVINSFDIAAWSSGKQNATIRILDEDDVLLYERIGNTPRNGHLTLPGSPVIGPIGKDVRLRVEDFGDQGIDNINFSQYSQNAVPEPGSLAVWGLLGVGALAWGRRRRKK